MVQLCDGGKQVKLKPENLLLESAKAAPALQTTPEQIARLPPKLRERLLQRGILAKADVQQVAPVQPCQVKPDVVPEENNVHGTVSAIQSLNRDLMRKTMSDLVTDESQSHEQLDDM